ncbi:MAG TPA: matrixin family metalloprotease [Candidatus Bathyarchaeia archaeon]|nr:matrixin family metalloprotease [Candidatus Bathyarchaeia archaeon]
MKKARLITATIGALAFLFAFQVSVFAAGNANIPEKNGVYDVPGHPNLKVRVFVHEAKPNFGKKSESLPACVDPDSLSVVKSAGWKLPSGTWEYYVNSASAASFVGSSFSEIASKSFAEWENGTDLQTNFSYAGDISTSNYAYDKKNVLTWGSVSSSNALAVTYTWFDRRTKLAVENDTIMNKKFPWSWSSLESGVCGISGKYDVQDILTHELGHWVGLNDHYTSAYANNTMYGYGSTQEVKKDTLTTGDTAGVNKIY